MNIRLSKSKLTAFRQCPKRLWLEVHRRDLLNDSASSQQRFEAGHRVGALAQTQYPNGILIAPDNNLTKALTETAQLIRQPARRVLFEATFQAGGILVRADLLIPTKGGWHMAEVKSATQVKDYHIEDTAIQHWVVTQSGIPLTQTSLQLIDSKWTYPGGNHYSGLLKLAPVDALIAPLQSAVPQWVAAAQKVASGSEPKVRMGNQCNDPFACGFQSYCETLTTPILYPIAWLPNLRPSKRTTFEAKGFLDLRDLTPDDVSALSPKQQRVLRATLDKTAYFEPLDEEEESAVAGTRYYLDFETITFAVPIWAGTRPYQQIPFQWSCHVETFDAPKTTSQNKRTVSNQNGALTNEMFLDLSGNDPSRLFAETLIRTLGKTGTILVYNQAFEKRIIKELAERFDDLAPALNKLLSRVVDLLPLANAHYYHPSMEGSWSIKAVLPAIAPTLSYDNLEVVADGTGAQDAYLEAIRIDTSPARKAELDRALRTYCARDTEAMVVLLKFLSGEVKNNLKNL